MKSRQLGVTSNVMSLRNPRLNEYRHYVGESMLTPPPGSIKGQPKL